MRRRSLKDDPMLQPTVRLLQECRGAIVAEVAANHAKRSLGQLERCLLTTREAALEVHAHLCRLPA